MHGYSCLQVPGGKTTSPIVKLSILKFLFLLYLVLNVGLQCVRWSYLSLRLGPLAPTQLAGRPNSIWGHPGPKAQFLRSKTQFHGGHVSISTCCAEV